MITSRLEVIAQQGAATAAPPAPAASPAVPTPEELQRTIRKALQDAGMNDGGANRISLGPDGITITPSTPGAPGIHVPRRDLGNVIPPQAVDIAVAFFVMCAVMVIGWPIARAFGRRLERRGQVATLDSGTADQLVRIEQAVEAMSIEIERISESQRFMAKLQSDAAERALPTMERR